MQSFRLVVHYIRKKVIYLHNNWCMKRLSMLWMLALLLSGVATLAGCSSDDEDSVTADYSVTADDDLFFEIMGLTRKKAQHSNKGVVIKRFEWNGLINQIVDVTDLFESATFFNQKVPVNHVYIEQLPTAIQEMAGGSTRICRMKYKGEYYYDIYSLFSSTVLNIYNGNGERLIFHSTEEYEAFESKATNVCCILVLISKPVESGQGAP